MNRQGGCCKRLKLGLSGLWWLSWLCMTVCLWAAGEVYAEKVALVIGNQAYAELRPLNNPVNDATAVAEQLRILGFRVIGLTPGQDGQAALNLDKKQFFKILGRFQQESQEAELAFLYYAGHGAIIGKDSFLLPVDVSRPAGKSEIPVMASDGISLSVALSYLKSANGPRIAVFDACREILDDGTRSILGSDGSDLVRGGLGLPPLDSGQIIAFAGAAGQLVKDGKGKHSPYTQVLLNELENGQGRDITEFLQTVGGQFLLNNRELLANQRPEYTNSGVLPNQYYLAGKGGPTPPQPRPKRDADEIAWQDISNSQKMGDFDWFIAEFPGSSYVPLAKFKRDNLKPAGPVARQTWTNSLGMEFVMIPEGSFRMGDLSGKGYDSEQPITNVTIRKSFGIMTTEVTQGQWQALMGSNPSLFNNCGTNCPVETVSWDDIQDFIQKLNVRTGQHYRLPSEAEWEYAARAGTQTEYSWGDQASHEYANYGKDDFGNGLASGQDRWEYTSPVKSFDPNAWGLYDMHGNVCEWVEDTYHYSYIGHPGTESAWVSGDTKWRVLRGGSWSDQPVNLRAASSGGGNVSDRFNNSGFRLVQGR